MKIRLLLVSAVLAAPAAARDSAPVSIDAGAIDACLSQAQVPEAQYGCVGKAAAACIETAETPNTIIQTECSAAELEWWKARLNRNYDALFAAHARTDPETASLAGAVAQAPLLEASQKAWLAWREAQCRYVESGMQGGSGAGPLWTFCQMDLTGRRAIELGLSMPDAAR